MPRRISEQQVDGYAGVGEIYVELPEGISKKELWKRYNLDFNPDKNGENGGYDYFWNEDLRSACGISLEGDMDYFVLFPRYYAKFNRAEFKRLLEDAAQLKIPQRWNSLLGKFVNPPRI